MASYGDLYLKLNPINPLTGLPRGIGGIGGYGGVAAVPGGLNLTPHATVSTGQNPLGGSAGGGGAGGGNSGDGGAGGSTGGGTGGYDVKSLLDQLLSPVQADLKAQGLYDLQGLNNAINRAFVQFGGVPDFNTVQKTLGLNLGDIVSPDTQKLAAENPYSAEKQLAQQHTDAVRTIRRALAARGALQSGELGYQLNRENQQYGQAQYAANQQLLDAIAGYQQGYVEGQRQRQQQEAQAGQSAIQQLLALFPQGIPGVSSPGGTTPAAGPAPSPTQAAPPQYQAYTGSTGESGLTHGTTNPLLDALNSATARRNKVLAGRFGGF